METKEKPNTDAIYSTYLVYCQRKGLQAETTPGEDTLKMMAADLQALREEYGV